MLDDYSCTSICVSIIQYITQYKRVLAKHLPHFLLFSLLPHPYNRAMFSGFITTLPALSLTLRVLHPYACCLSHHVVHPYTQPLDHLSVPSSVAVVAKSLFSAGWLAGAQRAVDTKCPCPSLSQTP